MSYSFSRDRTAELRGDPTSPQQQSPRYESPTRPPQTYNNDSNYAPHETYEMTTPITNVSDVSTMAGFFSEIDRLKADIDSINVSIDQINNLHTTALSSFNEQQSRDTAKQLEYIKTETQRKNQSIKNRIRDMENLNTRLPNDSDTQMRKSQTAAIRKRFLDAIQRYQDVERNYQMKYRQRIERQIRIVKPDATQDEVDDIIDSDGPPQVFAQSLMQAGRQAQAKSVLSEVQTRHSDIKHIEKTIVELHQLFMDMQMMVEQQGETLNNVEQNAETTAVNLNEGNKFLTRAISTAKSTRAKKWCCFFLCIGICVMIAILVWWFGFGHVGVGGSSNNDHPATTTIVTTAAPTPTTS
ncbi:t-SNARE [Backusella circina FSU 941]|nr:t-SNARE [Backusella circina FSU 941]